MTLEDATLSAVDQTKFGDYTAPLYRPNIALVAAPDDQQIIPTIQEAISQQYPSARVLVIAMPAQPGYRLRQLMVALYQGVRGRAPSRSDPLDENTLPFEIRAEFDCLIVDGAERLDKASLHYLRQDSNMPPSILVGRHHRLLTRISGDPSLKARTILM
jgi:hypothetical protein